MRKPIRQIRIEGNLAYVPLTKGYEAVIDADDVDLVGKYNWCAILDGRSVYAFRRGPSPERLTIRMHRFLMGDPDGLDIDHQDGDGLNNRRGNLRYATKSQNSQNQRLSKSSTSGLKGVCWHKARCKWRAAIRVNSKRTYLGHHDTIEAAYAAYVEASARLHGEFGRIK